MQQWLNANYESYIGIRPCDGIYQRDTNEALIYALQALENMSPSEANGNFGPKTISLIPTVSEGASGDIVKLIQYGLYVNNFYQDGDFDGNFSAAVASEIEKFRKFMVLPAGSLGSDDYPSTVDLRVIKGLLTSNGDTTRDSIAFDTATQLIDPAMIKRLYNSGFSIVGRYLTGTVGDPSKHNNKFLTDNEIEKLTDAGFSIVPIYEDGGSEESYFTEENGRKDAYYAANAARRLGFPTGTPIYFAADLDLQDGDIEGTVIAYLQAVRAALDDLGYKTGLYGTRNMCRHAAEGMGIDYFYVASMSYGWSGNLGFPMPKHWCFDQFIEYTTGSGVGIDQVAASGRDNGVGKGEFVKTDSVDADEALEYIFNNTNLQAQGKYVQRFDNVTVTYRATEEIANKNSNSVLTISNGEIPEIDFTQMLNSKLDGQPGLPEDIGHLTLSGLHQWGITNKIKRGNFELEIGAVKDGNFSVTMKYYIYEVEKGELSDTLSVEIEISIDSHHIDNWPQIDPKIVKVFAFATLVGIAALIVAAATLAAGPAGGGLAASIVALLLTFIP